MVLIVSPNGELRRQWRQALQRLTAIHEVATRSGLERSMATLKPAILLLDLALPRLRGVGGVRAIQRLSPPTKIILLTTAPYRQEGIAALKGGARGYCRTDTEPSLLKKAVEMVQKGEIWIGRTLIAHLVEELTTPTDRRKQGSVPHRDSRLDRLTPRQREVVALIGGGASNKEIASRLNVTEGTVRAHLTAIFRKTGLPDRLRLALLCESRWGRPVSPALLAERLVGRRDNGPGTGTLLRRGLVETSIPEAARRQRAGLGVPLSNATYHRCHRGP